MTGQYILEALGVVFSPVGLLALILSVGLGLVFGMLPGLTATMGVALLTGLTYSMDGPLAVLTLIGVRVHRRHFRRLPVRHSAEHPRHARQHGG